VEAIDHPREVQQGCFNPDGTRIVTSSTNGLIHISDAQGSQEFPPVRNFDNTARIVFSSDGRRLLTASLDGTARVWQVENWALAHRRYDFACGRANCLLPVPFGPTEQAAFSPDGRLAVVINGSNSAQIVTGDGPAAIGAVFPLDEPVRFAQFSGDGRRVLTAGTRTARVWEADSGAPAGSGT
jgi:WD40 repeat protein